MFIEEAVPAESPETIRGEVNELFGRIPAAEREAVTAYIREKVAEIVKQKRYHFWTVWYAEHRNDKLVLWFKVNDARMVFERIFGPLQRPNS